MQYPRKAAAPMPAQTPSARPVSEDGASVDRAILQVPDFELPFPKLGKLGDKFRESSILVNQKTW